MTIDDLVNECWADLPPIRKRLAGRDAVRRILVDAVQEWSPEYLAACRDNGQPDVYAADLTKRLERRYMQQDEYGFVLMTILLTALISAVVQWLVKWWLDNHFNEMWITQLQRELSA